MCPGCQEGGRGNGSRQEKARAWAQQSSPLSSSFGRLAERKKQQDKLRKDDEEMLSVENASLALLSLLVQEASQRGESRGRDESVEALRRKAEERVRYRSQERRREEQDLRAREALKKCEVEEELRAAKEELEARRRSAAQRAASHQRREKEAIAIAAETDNSFVFSVRA